jgi:hypothetical protein
MSPVTSYLLGAIGPLVFKSALYKLAFRFRGISATLLSCIIISGAGFFVLIPLPEVLARTVGLGIAIWLCQHYTEAELYPDATFIPIGVELFSLVVFSYGVPLIVG